MNTYFKGEFCARRPIVILVGMVLSSVGVCLAIIWVPQIRKTDLTHSFGVVCGLLFIATFLISGLFLLYQVIRNKKTMLCITSDGISYDPRMYPWDKIAQIGIMQKYMNRKDLYCVIRTHSTIVELPISRGLSSAEIAELFEKLRNEVVSNYSHVCLCEKD